MNKNEEAQEMLEIFRQLSREGKKEAISYSGTILKAETGMRRQYGLPPEGNPAQAVSKVGA